MKCTVIEKEDGNTPRGQRGKIFLAVLLSAYAEDHAGVPKPFLARCFGSVLRRAGTALPVGSIKSSQFEISSIKFPLLQSRQSDKLLLKWKVFRWQTHSGAGVGRKLSVPGCSKRSQPSSRRAGHRAGRCKLSRNPVYGSRREPFACRSGRQS